MAVWHWSLPASIAAMISSCGNPNSERAVLSLSVAPSQPHSSSWNSIAPRYITQNPQAGQCRAFTDG